MIKVMCLTKPNGIWMSKCDHMVLAQWWTAFDSVKHNFKIFPLLPLLICINVQQYRLFFHLSVILCLIYRSRRSIRQHFRYSHSSFYSSWWTDSLPHHVGCMLSLLEKVYQSGFYFWICIFSWICSLICILFKQMIQ